MWKLLESDDADENDSLAASASEAEPLQEHSGPPFRFQSLAVEKNGPQLCRNVPKLHPFFLLCSDGFPGKTSWL